METQVAIRYVDMYSKTSHFLKDERTSWNTIDYNMSDLFKTLKPENINIVIINTSHRHFTNIISRFCDKKSFKLIGVYNPAFVNNQRNIIVMMKCPDINYLSNSIVTNDFFRINFIFSGSQTFNILIPLTQFGIDASSAIEDNIIILTKDLGNLNYILKPDGQEKKFGTLCKIYPSLIGQQISLNYKYVEEKLGLISCISNIHDISHSVTTTNYSIFDSIDHIFDFSLSGLEEVK